MWSAHPGPQEEFLKASEYEVLYGGAKGGGKTDALIFDAVGQMNHPAASALFLRRTFPELREVSDRCHAIFPALGAEWRASDKRWRFSTGATFEFGYGESWEEVQQYSGREFTHLSYDELGNLKEERCWTFLQAQCRSKHKDVKVYIRASANPGGPGHAWLKRRFVEPTEKGKRVYRDPVTGLTRRFIPARVRDNPTLINANPLYLAQLQQLPETLRLQLLEGDWDTGSGFALTELGETTHLIPPLEIPPHWYHFAGFDLGFAHPWTFTGGVQAPSGDVYITHYLTGRQELPDVIADRIREETHGVKWGAVAGGLDCWHDHKARGESGPTTAERLQSAGIPLVRATISRISGLNNLRWYVALQNRDHPKVRFFDTPSCRTLVDHLRNVVTDPDRPEDALKVDSDPETGVGGDDAYDAFRYMMMLRPYSPELIKKNTGPLIGNVSSGRDHLVVPSPAEDDPFGGGQTLGEVA